LFWVETQQTHREYYFDLFDIETVRHPSIESEYPTRAKPDKTQSITDLQYRVDTIPFPWADQASAYIVYPRHGITVPISTPNETDQDLIRNGKAFNHYPYLDKWWLHYRGNNPEEGNGNMVIAAHSSYIKDAPGDFKTVFQALPISQIWDSIFLYLENDSGTFDLYTYLITDSFRTSMTDISVLSQDYDKKTLTTYGCYVIGDNSERWINQSILDSQWWSYTLTTKEALPATEHNTAEQKIKKDDEIVNPIEETQNTVVNDPNKSDSVVPTVETNPPEIIVPDEIIQMLPESMLPSLETLVELIQLRLKKEPELTQRVETRITAKFANTNEILTAKDQLELAIYLYLFYALGL